MGALEERGLAPADARIALLGFAFKSNSGDSRFTPVRRWSAKLRAAGCGLSRSATRWSPRARRAHHGIALEPDWRRTVAGADAVLILAGHDAFAAITPEDFAALAPGALIYDGRIYYPRGRIAALEAPASPTWASAAERRLHRGTRAGVNMAKSPEIVMVTGAAGFVGSLLIERLLAIGQTVHGLDIAPLARRATSPR